MINSVIHSCQYNALFSKTARNLKFEYLQRPWGIHQTPRSNTSWSRNLQLTTIHTCSEQRAFVNQTFFKPCALQRKFHLCIPFLGIARPQFQFPHLCVCERFTYSRIGPHIWLQQNRQTNPGNTVYKSLTDIWVYRNWETEHYNSVLEIRGCTGFVGIHKWEPDIYIWFSLALHLQCDLDSSAEYILDHEVFDLGVCWSLVVFRVLKTKTCRCFSKHPRYWDCLKLWKFATSGKLIFAR